MKTKILDFRITEAAAFHIFLRFRVNFFALARGSVGKPRGMPREEDWRRPFRRRIRRFCDLKREATTVKGGMMAANSGNVVGNDGMAVEADGVAVENDGVAVATDGVAVVNGGIVVANRGIEVANGGIEIANGGRVVANSGTTPADNAETMAAKGTLFHA